LSFIRKEQFKKVRKESLRRDKESPGGFTLDISENSPSYNTQKGQGSGCEVDSRQMGTSDLKILLSAKEVKGKIILKVILRQVPLLISI
jgi:hypothetical protein